MAKKINTVTKKLERNKSKNINRNVNGTDRDELNQHSYNSSFTYFDTLGFQVQTEKTQTPITVSKLNTVHTGVFNYQPNNYDWITSAANSKSICKDDGKYLTDKESWSNIFKGTSRDYDDKLEKLILEHRTPPCLHSDGFCKPILKHPYNFFTGFVAKFV